MRWLELVFCHKFSRPLSDWSPFPSHPIPCQEISARRGRRIARRQAQWRHPGRRVPHQMSSTPSPSPALPTFAGPIPRLSGQPSPSALGVAVVLRLHLHRPIRPSGFYFASPVLCGCAATAALTLRQVGHRLCSALLSCDSTSDMHGRRHPGPQPAVAVPAENDDACKHFVDDPSYKQHRQIIQRKGWCCMCECLSLEAKGKHASRSKYEIWRLVLRRFLTRFRLFLFHVYQIRLEKKSWKLVTY